MHVPQRATPGLANHPRCSMPKKARPAALEVILTYAKADGNCHDDHGRRTITVGVGRFWGKGPVAVWQGRRMSGINIGAKHGEARLAVEANLRQQRFVPLAGCALLCICRRASDRRRVSPSWRPPVASNRRRCSPYWVKAMHSSSPASTAWAVPSETWRTYPTRSSRQERTSRCSSRASTPQARRAPKQGRCVQRAFVLGLAVGSRGAHHIPQHRDRLLRAARQGARP
jgi:hypothetical protein